MPTPGAGVGFGISGEARMLPSCLGWGFLEGCLHPEPFHVSDSRWLSRCDSDDPKSWTFVSVLAKSHMFSHPTPPPIAPLR